MGPGEPKASHPATLADLLAIPEDVRHHELLAGEIFEKDAASGKHGQAQVSLAHVLFPFRQRGGGGPTDRPGGWLLASEAEIFFEERSTPRPDLAGWRRERLAELPPGSARIRLTVDGNSA